MAIASSVVGPLHAQERFHRLFNADDGLNPPSVRSLTQDRAGFLWIGTEGGLVRYDGVEMRRWSPTSLDRTITRVVASPEGPVVALRQGALFTITSTGAERILGPEGQPIEKARDVAFDATGALWIIRGDEVWRRDLGGRWTRTSIPLAEGERPLLVREHVGDAIHLVTNYGLWRLAPAKSAAPILPSLEDLLGYDEVFVDVHTTGDGRVLALTFLGRVLELTDAGPRELFRTDRIGAGGRAIGIVDRAGTIWVSVDRYLIGWRSGKSPVVLGRDESIESGGPLLVDHEGSLWMGSFVGLYQFAEPETPYWTERQGLPSSHTRYLARTGDTVWITTWYGAGYLRQGPGGWEIGGVSGWMPSRLFVDSRGALWAGTEHGLIEMRDGHAASRHLAGPVGLYALHETAEGTIWVGTSAGLLVREPRKASLRNVPVPELSGNQPPVESVLVDGQGDLWVSSGETVCHARAGPLRASAEAEWACESIPGAVHVSGGGLVEMPSGALWLSTNRLGVLRRVGDRWEPVPGVQTLPSRSILSLVPSRSEGIWIVGHGALHRVTEAVGDSLGWRVEEHLTAWHGLPVTSGTHLLEDSDGGLWVTTTLGVSYVPAAARFATLDPPRVALVDARVDDQPVSLGSALELPHDRNRLELRFAALSFRDPSLIRYQVRLSPDDPWLDTAGTPFFRWVDMPAGRYEAQVRASLDGERWSMAPANFSFHVAPPWYREWWAVTLFLTLGVVAVYAAHRLRVGHLLDLERQRTRIAMDLHDEIGSGLGSIGILSGILTANGLEPPDERRMAREISATAGQLGTALSQIVWTLDPKVRTMEEVAGRLAELGRRLFPGDRTEFTTRFPDRWHEARPSQLVRRNVVLIGLEALHNAARHAHANRVELHVYPAENGRWELDVIDDGVGLPGDRGTSGVGLRSMRRRAEEIGAQLTWSCPNGKGTKVRLIFQPRGSSRRKFGGFWHAARSSGGS
jgi:signal transduction histidine kinase/ligand-binding sensor domain-containing protein